jgi:phosphate uptake regulator
MTTASIHSTDTPDAEAIHSLVATLDQNTISLGKDAASRSVRASVKALRTAIEGGADTVASTLLALDASVDRLHMSHMRPLFKQTLRTLRTALNMDVKYAPKPPAYEHRPRD